MSRGATPGPMPLPAFLTRLRERADRASRGSAVPAGSDPEAPPPSGPSSRERGAMRRRARALRRRREVLLLELGALAYELRRQERTDSGLMDAKVAELRGVDDEERGLAAALGDRRPLVEVVRAGIAGTCESCGAIAGTGDAYCARCGTELPSGGRRRAERTAAEAGPPEGSTEQPARDEPAGAATGDAATGDAGAAAEQPPGGAPAEAASGEDATAPAPADAAAPAETTRR
jgi:hypothetical protein